MRLASFLIAATVAVVLPAAAFGEELPPLDLRGGLSPGDANVTTAPAPAPLPILDETVTGAIPKVNPRVKPAAAEPPVEPTRRTVEDKDPFAPLGIRAGGFILFPSVTVGVGYSSNGPAKAGGKGAGFVEVLPELKLQSDWAAHEATLTLRGSYQKFFDSSSGDQPTAGVAATGRIDLPDGWSVDLDGTYDFSRESVTDPRFPVDADPTTGVNAFSASAGLNRTLGRGEFTLEGRTERTRYGEASAGGVVVSQSDRDNTLYGARLRLGYEATPFLTPFIEGEFTRRAYDQAIDAGGIARASRGATIRAGVALDSGPVLTGEIAVGGRREVFDDPVLAGLRALTVDGSLVWSPTPLVTVATDLSTLINPATDPASSGSVEYDGSLDVAYAWRRDVTFDLTGGIDHEHFQGTGETDRTYRVGAGVTWKLNRHLWLTGTYDHAWLASTDAANNYKSDTVRIDLRIQR